MPAYNEEASLGTLLRRIHQVLTEAEFEHLIIVVDDGSHDRTPDILRASDGKLPLMVETHPVNQGLGAALRDGFKPASAVSSAQDVVVTMDADDSHSPALIPGMVQMIREGAIS